MPNTLTLPTIPWAVLKRIVRAYAEVQDEENPTVEHVAGLADLQRTTVSSNNNFLREIGVLAPGKGETKLTDFGLRLAQTLALEKNEVHVAEALQEIVRSSPGLHQFVSKVRARGPLKIDYLRNEIALVGGVTDKNKQPGAVKAILDLLQESKLIEVTDDTVVSSAMGTVNRLLGLEPTDRSPAPQQESPSIAEANARVSLPEQQNSWIPFALGPSRLVYVRLCENWNGPKDLPKLLKLMQTSLGDSEES